ncbi:MAG: CDP-diacylglycerol--glycerol-3-phosphate 3-phosphatidyltransferase [Planctomycetota bacterium]
MRRIPNALVLLRLVLTVIVLAMLAAFDGTDESNGHLAIATALFVIAALTDAIDGWLARRWDAVTVFGRVMDPLADKVLVLGAFVMLAGPNLATSGVAPWMVVVMVTRELLVTSLRGMLEGRGIDFSAAAIGKAKMIAQSVGAPAIMLLVLLASETRWPALIAWTITLITAASAIPYCTRAISATKNLEA